MRTPFRWQVSEYDCVPTTVLNAFSYLYERHEIPPVVVQRVFLYCLDSISRHKDFGHGTSGHAIQLLVEWINSYQTKAFAPQARYLSGTAVHLAQNNPIVTAINAGGVALLRVTFSAGEWHYVLALSTDRDWINCFDPYPRTVRSSKPGCYEFIERTNGQEPNLRIARQWLDTLSSKGKFRLGPNGVRETVIISRGGA